jgi:hypothetical protein
MILYYRFLYSLFITAAVVPIAAAQLQPGDIVVMGVQSDGVDRFTWAPLVDLGPGQVVYFTDGGWNSEEQVFQRQVNAASNPYTTPPSGGAMVYTAPLEGLKAGTVVEVQINSRRSGEPGEYVLTVTGASAEDFSAANDKDVVGDQGLSIATTGDQLLILTGSLLHPFFLFGVNTGADQWDLGSTSAQHSSDLPDGLIDGLTAIAIGAGPDGGDEVDNGRYTGPISGTQATILSMIADLDHWETSNTAFDDLTGGIAILDIIIIPSTPVAVALDTLFVAPGDTARIPVTLVNTTAHALGFLRFRLILKGAAIFAAQNPVHGLPDDLEIETISVAADTLIVFVTPRFDHQPILTEDSLRIVGQVRIIPADNALGKTVGVHILEDTTFVIKDMDGLSLMTSGSNGAVQVGIRGDINIDRRVNILDATSLVYRIIHDKIAAPGTIGYQLADINVDGLVNIVDVIGTVRVILGLPLGDPVQTRPVSPGGLSVRLHPPRQMKDNRLAIPLSVSKGGHVAGLQATFRFDSSRLEVGQLASISSSSTLIIEQVVHKDILNIIAISPALSFFSTDEDLRMMIPVSPLTSERTDFSLIELTLIDAQGRELDDIGVPSHQTVNVGKERPATFSLSMNTPNPFNPRTKISYQVPSAAHVALKIYNLLGQEVITLVDRKHTAGRYSAIWDARNYNGEPVASGIYIYRLTSDAGDTEVRRMTVLK